MQSQKYTLCVPKFSKIIVIIDIEMLKDTVWIETIGFGLNENNWDQEYQNLAYLLQTFYTQM